MGLGSTESGLKKTFLTIIGGKIKEPSEESAPGAERRDWELQDGTKGTKWEKTHNFVEGNIVGLNYKDGEYGTSLIVDIQDGAETFSLQISTKSRYYDDFAKKVKSIDLSKPVTLTPFDFESEKDKDKNGNPKKIVGVTVRQDGEKVKSFYYDGKKSINKMPKVDEKEKKEMGKDYWTIYFTKVGVFLRKEIEGVEVPEPQVFESKSNEVTVVNLPADDLPF